MILFRGRESNPRSMVKAISWRVLGSIDTFLLSFLFTSSAKAAGAIASTEVLTKIFLYYGHERIWSNISWGMSGAAPADATDTATTPATQTAAVTETAA